MKPLLANQKGAMLVEFLVVASSVLISLFILIPYLAKVTDLRHKNEQTAQYASWERTVRYGNTNIGAGKLKETAEQRVLNNANALISTNDVAFKADSFHYFVDSKTGSPQYSELLGKRGTNNDFLNLTSSAQSSNSNLTGSVAKVVNGVKKITTFDPDDNFLNEDYFTTVSKLTVKQPSWIAAFTQDSQIMKTEKTILVDGWGVKGKKENKKIVNTLQPIIFNQSGNVDLKGGLNLYKDIYKVLSKTLKVITIDSLDIDDDLDELEFDHVDTEILLYPDGYPNNNNNNKKETGEQLGTY